ncbi:50S ribosomal protein L15e [Candidatus Woesearchaeota archaeon CG10_big_fil_rev_8_21_14_0_10_45_16]|nr:MAG: 50S ribosomal protein L15e [Candidatus Woesearchaeota archaeon CG10_big_fil_rev_8_21_14_0_10_45_16]
MSLYKNLRELWKKPKENMPEVWRERLLQWRQEPTTVKAERPTRLDRARSLGYKAKQGFVIIRQRVPRGGHRRPKPGAGRRPKRYGTRLNLSKNYQQIAEERAQKKFLNLTVLNSYWAAEDGKFYWYEVIMVDPHHPVIKADKNLQWLQTKKNQTRVFQGKTSAGRKGRGIR